MLPVPAVVRELVDSVKRLVELDTTAVADECAQRAQSACPEHGSLAIRSIRGLDPNRWRLEWQLPWWLGMDMGLELAVARQLVLSNVLGLASLRLRDDLHDDDLLPEDRPAAPDVSEALYRAATDILRGMFPPSSEIWRELRLQMSYWRGAVELDSATRPHLARRAAPLKVSAFAVCELTERPEIYQGLASCLDLFLTAMVLYDHLCDWEDDLACGRWNAFLGDASDRRDVLAQLMARDTIDAYMGRVRREFDRALEICSALMLPRLTSELAGIAAEVQGHAGQLQAHYRQLGDRAVTLMFGDTWRATRTPLSVPA